MASFRCKNKAIPCESGRSNELCVLLARATKCSAENGPSRAPKVRGTNLETTLLSQSRRRSRPLTLPFSLCTQLRPPHSHPVGRRLPRESYISHLVYCPAPHRSPAIGPTSRRVRSSKDRDDQGRSRSCRCLERRATTRATAGCRYRRRIFATRLCKPQRPLQPHLLFFVSRSKSTAERLLRSAECERIVPRSRPSGHRHRRPFAPCRSSLFSPFERNQRSFLDASNAAPTRAGRATTATANRLPRSSPPSPSPSHLQTHLQTRPPHHETRAQPQTHSRQIGRAHV